MHGFVAAMRESDSVERGIDTLAHRGGIESKIQRAKGNILAHAGREKLPIRVLEDQPDV